MHTTVRTKHVTGHRCTVARQQSKEAGVSNVIMSEQHGCCCHQLGAIWLPPNPIRFEEEARRNAPSMRESKTAAWCCWRLAYNAELLRKGGGTDWRRFAERRTKTAICSTTFVYYHHFVSRSCLTAFVAPCSRLPTNQALAT